MTPTDTLPDPATLPLEPTTPIRPSEAIRLGCLIAPRQAFATWFADDGSVCVLGAMILGFGGDGDNRYPPGYISFLEGTGSLSGRLMGYNDDDHWSRERIADWLAEQGL